MRIIALDIDDCILPTNVNYFGMTDDAEIMLEVNLKRLRMICQKWNMKVFITSSWYVLLKFEEGDLTLKYGKDEEKPTARQFKLIKKYIGEFVVGLSCGNRETDILTLVDAGHKVVALDDIDLSHLQSENCLYCLTRGFINGNHGYKIKNFLGE